MSKPIEDDTKVYQWAEGLRVIVHNCADFQRINNDNIKRFHELLSAYLERKLKGRMMALIRPPLDLGWRLRNNDVGSSDEELTAPMHITGTINLGDCSPASA